MKIWPDIEIDKKKLSLTTPDAASAAALAVLLQDSQDAVFYLAESFKAPSSEEAIATLLNDWNSPPDSLLFILRADGEPCGLLSLEDIDMISRRAEWGLGLHPDYRGKGLAFKASVLFLDYCFGELGLRRLFCKYLEGNAASQSLCRKLGFKYEGRFRKYQKRAFSYLDAECYSLLEDEYAAERPHLLAEAKKY